MDVRRHDTAGRLSELFGADTLETDEFIRTLGWREVAEQELPLLQPATRAALDAYAAGVNAYLDSHSPSEIAVEYTVLGLGGLDYRPEPWTAVDSLAWLKAMAWDLKGNLDEEIERALLSADHTPERGRRAVPGLRLPGAPADRRPGRGRGRRLRAGRDHGRYPQPAASGVHGRSARAARRAATALLDRLPQLPGQGSTGSAATAGSSTASTARRANRCWPTTRTSASACRASGCRWGCTAAPSATSARSTSPASRSRGCRAWSSATTPTSPGVSPTSGPTSPTSTSSGSPTRSGSRTAACGR